MTQKIKGTNYSITVNEAFAKFIVYSPAEGTNRFKTRVAAAAFLKCSEQAVGQALTQRSFSKLKLKGTPAYTVKGRTVSDVTDPSTANNHSTYWRRYSIFDPATNSTVYAPTLIALALELMADTSLQASISLEKYSGKTLAAKLSGLLSCGNGKISVGPLTVVKRDLLKISAPINRYLEHREIKIVVTLDASPSMPAVALSGISSSSTGASSSASDDASIAECGGGAASAGDAVAGGRADEDALCSFGVCDIPTDTTTLDCTHNHCTPCLTQWKAACASYINEDYGEGFLQPQVFTCPFCRAEATIKAASEAAGQDS